jgi:hypothetical protein
MSVCSRAVVTEETALVNQLPHPPHEALVSCFVGDGLVCDDRRTWNAGDEGSASVDSTTGSVVQGVSGCVGVFCSGSGCVGGSSGDVV